MGRDYCLSLLQLHRNLTMQVKCNLDEHFFCAPNLPHGCESDTKKSEIHFPITNQTCSSFEKNNRSVVEDSGGSDSNPSEDNISESEALKLLSRTRLLQKRKKKKHRKTKSKSKKSNSQKVKRESRSCTVVEIGKSPFSEDTGRNSFNARRRDVKSHAPIEKRNLSCLTFPLGPWELDLLYCWPTVVIIFLISHTS